MEKLVAFTLNEQLYGLSLNSAERILRIVGIVPIPNSPSYILGVINLHGQIIPVIDLRKRLNLPEEKISISDQLFICKSKAKTMALLVDNVTDVIAPSLLTPSTTASNIISESSCIKEVMKFENKLIFILNEKALLLDRDNQGSKDDAYAKHG